MPPKKKYSDEVLLESYFRLKNVWKVADELTNICGQSVWERLKKLNVLELSKPPEFTEAMVIELIEIYKDVKRGDGKIDKFCLKFNISRQNVSRKARRLNISDRTRKLCDKEKDIKSIGQIEWYRNNEHPKGMLGKKHSNESKAKMSESSINMWKDPSNKLNSKEHRDNLSIRMSKTMSEKLKTNPESIYSNSKKGWVQIDENRFYARSSWEANIAAYLQFLKEKNQIKSWEHEPETFWFNSIKRGVRSYLPDFRITQNDDTIYFIEVKGYMDAKSKTKLSRMKKYYPLVRIELIDSKRYKEISKSRILFKHWGSLDVTKL